MQGRKSLTLMAGWEEGRGCEHQQYDNSKNPHTIVETQIFDGTGSHMIAVISATAVVLIDDNKH